MSFDLYLQCYESGRPAGLPRAAIRALLPVVEAESRSDLWRIRYDDLNFSDVFLDTQAENPDCVVSICIHRPCADDRLWAALYAILRMGHAVLYFPGGSSPLAADEATAAHLPSDMVESLGRPRCVRTGLEIKQAVENA